MISRLLTLLLATSGVVILGACHGDSLGAHGCPVEYSSGWSGHGLDLEHTLPEKCPVFVSYAGQSRETGALVIDGGTAEFQDAFLNVYDFSGEPVGLSVNDFRYGGDGRWSTAVATSYSAGRDNFSPDRAFFRLVYKSGTTGPNATMRITYTNAVSASISGPGTVNEGAQVTYSANVTTGQPPFTYRWYRGWELVGMEASYTDVWHGSGNVDLRLDVIDARGEADSDQRDVTISPCPFGERAC